jgi:hypothetical protein
MNTQWCRLAIEGGYLRGRSQGEDGIGFTLHQQELGDGACQSRPSSSPSPNNDPLSARGFQREPGMYRISMSTVESFKTVVHSHSFMLCRFDTREGVEGLDIRAASLLR